MLYVVVLLASSYIAVRYVFLGHLRPPQLQQDVPVLLVEWTTVGQETSGQQHVSHQVSDLLLKRSGAVRPTHLKYTKQKKDGCMD